MALKTSNRSEISAFRALDILRDVNGRIEDGQDIRRLEAGQPCFGAPEEVLEKARECLVKDPRQGYTEALGMTPLRQRISEYYKERYGVNIDYTRIAITMGSSGGFLLAFLGTMDVGDRVAMASPGYPAYRNFLKSLGIIPVEFDVDEATNYQPTVEHLEKLKGQIDGLIICSPANPTGTIISSDELAKIAKWCEKNDVRLFSDEVYHGITYEEPAETSVKFSDKAVVLNSFSKYFAMTGWRLGWLVLPEETVDAIKRLAENLFVSPPTLAQHAALEIFNHRSVLDGYLRVYKTNRDIMRKELPEAGICKLSRAQGAFYFYADVSDLTDDSIEFCKRVLDEAKVSFTPGVDFDLKRGKGTIRISYAGATEDVKEACARLKEWKASNN